MNIQSKVDVVPASWGANQWRGWRDRPRRPARISRAFSQALAAGMPTTSNNEPETSSFMQHKKKRNNSKPPIWRGPRGCTKRALFRVWISPSQSGTLTLAEEEEAKALSGTDALSYVGLAHSTQGRNWDFRIEALARAWNRSGFGRRVGSRPLRSGGGRMRNFGRLSVCRQLRDPVWGAAGTGQMRGATEVGVNGWEGD